MKLRKIEVNFSDERGTISDIFYKEQIEHVAVIDTNDGGRIIRGNHYHKLTTQHIYMAKGSLRYWYKPVEGDEPAKVVDVPEGYLVSTPPLEIHALEHLEASRFIVFSTGLRGGKDYEADTFRVPPILA
jgi:dTDP-4-dehydrorhamnose 3,5-epimerase-like enzyme